MARAPHPIPEPVKWDVEKAREALLFAYNRLEGPPKWSLDRIIARLESWQRGNGGEPP
jgi:hypothetical protein